jgi:hypothetical protein
MLTYLFLPLLVLDSEGVPQIRLVQSALLRLPLPHASLLQVRPPTERLHRCLLPHDAGATGEPVRLDLRHRWDSSPLDQSEGPHFLRL